MEESTENKTPRDLEEFKKDVIETFSNAENGSNIFVLINGKESTQVAMHGNALRVLEALENATLEIPQLKEASQDLMKMKFLALMKKGLDASLKEKEENG